MSSLSEKHPSALRGDFRRSRSAFPRATAPKRDWKARIFVHDYCGHPFQIQLSRWLAENGHVVCHCYSQDIESPRGNLAVDPSGPEIRPISQGRPVAKYSLARRALQEQRYGSLAAAQVHAFQPDIVISSNAPPTIQRALQRAAARSGGRFVYWLQDIYSAMLDRVVLDKLPVVGRPLSLAFRSYEFGVMASSDAVVVISEDFVDHCCREGVPREKITVQHNWAPLTEMPRAAHDNAWARQNGLAGKFVFLFSGTLGLKHNPGLLSNLAVALRERPEVVVAVVSQGAGRLWLEGEVKAKKLDNLKLFDFQPYDRMPEVLGSADVLTAVLEPFAGTLSVPSKILSYLCAERPLLAALPKENLASRIIENAGAGKVVSPFDENGFVSAAQSFIDDAALRRRCAAAGRAFASRNFDIERIGDRFLTLFHDISTRVPLRVIEHAAFAGV